MSYVLAIEPHHAQASILLDNVAAGARAAMSVVSSLDAAMVAINRKLPKLVLVSALMPSDDERRLVERLRALPRATAPQILIIPDLAKPGAHAPPRSSLIDRFRKQSTPVAGCDPSTFAADLAAYLPPDGDDDGSPRSTAVDGSERRRAERVEGIEWARVQLDGADSGVVDLSLTGAQVVAPNVLRPGESVHVLMANAAEAVECRASVIWSTVELIGSAQELWYRAGLHFKDADRQALERLCFQQG